MRIGNADQLIHFSEATLPSQSFTLNILDYEEELFCCDKSAAMEDQWTKE